MISVGTLILLGILTFLYYLFKKSTAWDKSPPGPKPYPLLGSIPHLGRPVHLAMSNLAKEYGPIMRIDLGPEKGVVISDHKMVKEMFSDTAFSGRPDWSLVDTILDPGKTHGVIKSDGPHWEEMRRFTLRQLRDFGFGKCSMEELIMTEVREFLDRLKQVEGKPVNDFKNRVTLAVVNSLWTIAAGQRFKQDDPGLIKFANETMGSFDELGKSFGIAIVFPWIARTFPSLTRYDKVKEMMVAMQNFVSKPIAEHKKTLEEDYDRDYIDVFLKQIKKSTATDSSSAFAGKLGDKNLVASLADLFVAGTDTTSSTMAWLVLYLSRHPEKQRKLQKEIESLTGNSRPPSLSDRPSMPFTEAVIAEILRLRPITATGAAHRAVEDKEFHGYLIPKDCSITPNIYHIHHDPAIWGDPEEFRPERFLSENETVFKKPDALIPFSIGRRQCLGETLARDSLFLYTTNLFQKFDIEFDKNGPDNGYEDADGVMLVPKPYNVIMKERV